MYICNGTNQIIMSIITAGSLYAGVGGICLGLKQAGISIAWANEYDKNACTTYRKNFSHPLIEGDIMDIDIDSLAAPDIIAAGFPCQPFSVAGYRKGFGDPRGNHFFRVLDFVDKMRPKALFLENVKNLAGHDGGKTFKLIKKEITERGYSFYEKILNTKDYGNIPHNRERIFIIALDRYALGDLSFNFPKGEKLSKNVTDMLETGNIEEKYYYRKDKYMFPLLKEAMQRTDTVYQFRRQYVRENKSNVCPALTANMGTGGHNVPLVKTPQGIRKLTPRECFRFQGFPDSFRLPDIANSHLYKQAGNSVSVPVITKLATELAEVLQKKAPRQTTLEEQILLTEKK